MISFVGAMPANAIICVSDSGKIKLELGFNGSCDCEEESSEHIEHNTCEDSTCSIVEIKSDDCSDSEIESFESDLRSNSLDFSSYKTLSLFDFNLDTHTYPPITKKVFWPLSKPSLPPPQLRTIAITQLLI